MVEKNQFPPSINMTLTYDLDPHAIKLVVPFF